MEHEKIFELCKTVATTHGYCEKPGTTSAFYADPFGCDFEIHYHSMRIAGTDKMGQSVDVHLGGREVYSWSDTLAEYGEIYVPGCWEDLLVRLGEYELNRSFGDFAAIKHSLVEQCRREAVRNREFFEKYTKLCVEIAKEDGERKEYEHSVGFVVEREVKGEKIKIEFSEGAHRGSGVYLSVGDERVFNYRWGNDDDLHQVINEKGKITDNMKWKSAWWTFLKSRH